MATITNMKSVQKLVTNSELYNIIAMVMSSLFMNVHAAGYQFRSQRAPGDSLGTGTQQGSHIISLRVHGGTG